MAKAHKFSAIILAAGRGARMKSDLPKVLHCVAGLEMVFHVLKAVKSSGAEHTTVVTSPDQDALRDRLQTADAALHMATQERPLGTGDAVKTALPLPGSPDRVLILFGDTPLMRPEILRQMVQDGSDVTLLGFHTPAPDGYGRIICEKGRPVGIVEHKDADDKTRRINLCNGGAMAVAGGVLPGLLDGLKNENAQSEYYLPGIVALAKGRGASVGLVECRQEDTLGVDTRNGLARAEAIMQARLREKHMANGVSLIAPETVFFSHDTEIGPDTLIEPHCFFGPGVTLGASVTVKGFSHLEGVKAAKGAQIGPYARLRPGTRLGEGAKIGNFVETKKSDIGEGAKVNHLSYVGDARVGAGANIGAGTITCNYDGFDKHLTEIGAGAFIGSNSSLIAPVKIGEGAYVGSSSAVSGEIAADSLALTRAPLREIDGWSANFRLKKTKARDAGDK